MSIEERAKLVKKLDVKMKELCEAKAERDSWADIVDGIGTEVKEIMDVLGLTKFIGDEHTAIYSEIFQSRFDSKTFGKEHPEMAEKYTKTTSYRRLMVS